MSSYNEKTPPPPEGGDNGKDKYQCDPPPPPPPPSECPDPCSKKPNFGPPAIPADCCDDECCPKAEEGSKDPHPCCTWDQVEDPCVKASACRPYTKVTCNCSSENAECDCEEWDCSCYPQGTCVPCDPCQGLIPPDQPPDQPPPDGSGPNGEECTAEGLQKKLDDLNASMTAQQNQKAQLEAEIKASSERQKLLTELIKTYGDLIKKYKEQRYKLICKEDCLKGFHRDVTAAFDKYPQDKLANWQQAINDTLCGDELAKCCQKNLEGKLSKFTRLIWEQQQAEKAMKKAEQAFATIKDLPKWIDDQFTALEKMTELISKGLNDPDPEMQKWAFYLFFWKFVPGLCKCFPYRFCCPNPKPEDEGAEKSQQAKQGNEPTPAPEDYPHLGCAHGDWHPSAITEEVLKKLICCSWDFMHGKKDEYRSKSEEVAKVTANLDTIKKKVEADAKTVDERIKKALENAKAPGA